MSDQANVEQLWEYIESLQRQIDALVNMDEKRRLRIERLERDRESLRQRLADQGSRRSLFRGDKANPPPISERNSDPGKRVLEVPGVGVIEAVTFDVPTPARPLRVGTVLDQFSGAGFSPEFESVPLGARSWREEVDRDPNFDLLLVESAYAGHDGSWATRVAHFHEPSVHLVDLVSWFRDRGIPTVFWNKEDPINFDWFVGSASLFDHVFTVDGDTIPKYRSILGHDRVHLLQFFAQPTIHYLGPWEGRVGTVAFAGSYYAAKHAERREQLEMLLDPALDFGLQIFDRHAGTDQRFSWPEKYRSHIVGSLSYMQTVEAYRRYKVFLNVNTVTESPTMCSRRVFELAACGTPIVTARSRAIDEMLPGDSVRVVDSAADTRRALSEMLDDEGYLKSMAERARAWVLDGHTASARVDELLGVIDSG